MADKDKYADEIMSDEELDQVAGGNYKETADDSLFLSFHGLCKKYNGWEIWCDSGTSKEEEVKAAWAKLGVRLEYRSNSWGGDRDRNRYFINDVEVTREGAYSHALIYMGEHGIPS